MNRLLRRPWAVGQLDLARPRTALASIALLTAAIVPATVAAEVHTVTPGESLSQIANRYGVDMRALATFNGIKNPDLIFSGSTLNIPGPGVSVSAAGVAKHTVLAGDTLSKLARQYGVSLSQLVSDNNIANPDLIVEGQVLTIGGAEQDSSPGASATTHRVTRGDTLSSIARMYGVPIVELAALNRIGNTNLIIEGQVLVLGGTTPQQGSSSSSATTHTVVTGDTLAKIANQYGVLMSELASRNGISNPDLIRLGQVITISGTAAVPAPPAAGSAPREEIQAILRQVEGEFDIPSGLLQALAWQESGWQQHVVSHAGAVGVTQLLPNTALWALEFLLESDADWERSARDNIRVGASVMRHYLRLTAGDVRWSLAAYYQGWQSVQDFGMFEETELYVANVMLLWDQFR